MTTTEFAETVPVAVWKKSYDEDYEHENTNYNGRLPDKEPLVVTAGCTGFLVKAEDGWCKKSLEEYVTREECKDKVTEDMSRTC